jgi:hypothetical protein
MGRPLAKLDEGEVARLAYEGCSNRDIVPLEDVQHLASHSNPRTTRLFERRRKKVTRNIVERISI